MSVTVIVNFHTKPDKANALKELLSGLQSKVIEAGGLSISLVQDQDDPQQFFEIEKWNTANDHKKFAEAAAAAGAFKPLEEMLDKPFSVNYLDTVKHTEA